MQYPSVLPIELFWPPCWSSRSYDKREELMLKTVAHHDLGVSQGSHGCKPIALSPYPLYTVGTVPVEGCPLNYYI